MAQPLGNGPKDISLEVSVIDFMHIVLRLDRHGVGQA